jgi:phosphatidylserine decarboxylase
VQQGAEMGFIKFGSRVDLLLPLDAEITVKLKEITKGGISLIAKW